MLYVGHFSFTIAANGETEEDGPSHGIFTCVAEADDVDGALEKLHTLIVRLKEEDDTLDGVDEVYLDSCVEVREMPEDGLMTFWVRWPHGEDTSLSTGLRWADDDQAVGFAMLPDDEDDVTDEAGHDHEHGDEDEDDVFEVEPFVEF